VVLSDLVIVDAASLDCLRLVSIPCLHGAADVSITVLPNVRPVHRIVLDVDTETGATRAIAGRAAVGEGERDQKGNTHVHN